MVGHITKGADYEEAVLALLSFLSLILTGSHYSLKPHPRLTRISYLVLAYSVLAVMIYGITGFYFMDKRHFGAEFHLWESVKIILRMFFLFDDSGITPLTRFAHSFVNSIYVFAGLVVCFIFYSILRPYFRKPFNSEEDFNIARQLVEKFGKSPLDFFKTYPDKLLFISSRKDGFVSFKMTRHFAFVLENPVCADDESLLNLVREFDRFCSENGFISIYYRVPQESLGLYRSIGKKSFPIGEEAIVDLSTFTLEGGKMKTTRSAINRLTAEGFEFKVYNPPILEGLLQKLELVSGKWLEEMKEKEMAFTQGVFDKAVLKEQVIITVEDSEEKVYAFLNLIPDYAPGESTYDLIRKIHEGNGIHEGKPGTCTSFRHRGGQHRGKNHQVCL